jgi:hypothetical protein
VDGSQFRETFIPGRMLSSPDAGGMRTASLNEEGVFPLSLEGLWELIHAHLDERRLSEIHPRFVSGRSIREGQAIEYAGRSFPREKVAERVIRVGGRPQRTTWNYRIEPPIRYDYDFTFPNGSSMRFENRYSSAQGGTLVKTAAEISLKRVPSFLALRIVRRSLDRSDREDSEFAKRLGLH